MPPDQPSQDLTVKPRANVEWILYADTLYSCQIRLAKPSM